MIGQRPKWDIILCLVEPSLAETETSEMESQGVPNRDKLSVILHVIKEAATSGTEAEGLSSIQFNIALLSIGREQQDER